MGAADDSGRMTDDRSQWRVLGRLFSTVVLCRNFVYRPVRDSECTQPTMRDFAFSMSFFEKKSSGLTLSIG